MIIFFDGMESSDHSLPSLSDLNALEADVRSKISTLRESVESFSGTQEENSGARLQEAAKIAREHARKWCCNARNQLHYTDYLFLPQRKRSNCNEILQHAKNESRILSKVNIYWLSTVTAFSPNKSNVRITIREARGWIDWARIKGSAWRTATRSFAKATVAKHAWWYAKATHRGEKWSADNSENYYSFKKGRSDDLMQYVLLSS